MTRLGPGKAQNFSFASQAEKVWEPLIYAPNNLYFFVSGGRYLKSFRASTRFSSELRIYLFSECSSCGSHPSYLFKLWMNVAEIVSCKLVVDSWWFSTSGQQFEYHKCAPFLYLSPPVSFSVWDFPRVLLFLVVSSAPIHPDIKGKLQTHCTRLLLGVWHITSKNFGDKHYEENTVIKVAIKDNWLFSELRSRIRKLVSKLPTIK